MCACIYTIDIFVQELSISLTTINIVNIYDMYNPYITRHPHRQLPKTNTSTSIIPGPGGAGPGGAGPGTGR